MRYWDASAIVPLPVEEVSSDRSRTLLTEDPMIATWWLSKAECASALNRVSREGDLTPADLRHCLSLLERLSVTWTEVQPVPEVRLVALRLLRLHPVRADDAMQLASAVALAGENRSSLPFVCYDDRLGEAADREGFPVLEAEPT